MSEEESPVNYNDGDIVWVKLGSCWWPAEVKDTSNLPVDILDFKKQPLVIVKFFNEDSYEYIRSWNNIYPYSSEKKNDFIKKGMAAFRSKVPHMEKFPKDVTTAEITIGGNPNILSDPMFLPEKKRNYVAEVFGTPSPKPKVNKEKKARSSIHQKEQKDTSHITHRRFLGVDDLGLDDYKAYICIQYPGKDRIPGDKEDEEVLRINREPEQDFNCHSCSFTTKRLEVMILHTKSHIQGVYVSSPRRNKRPVVRRHKKEKTKKSRSSDDIVESETSSTDSDVFEVTPRERKRKTKSQSIRKTKKRKVGLKETKPTADIRSDLLAEWEDSDEDLDNTLTYSNEESLNQSTDIVSKSADDMFNTSVESKQVDETLAEPPVNISSEDVSDKSNVLDHSVETEKKNDEFEEVTDELVEKGKENQARGASSSNDGSETERIDKQKSTINNTQNVVKSCFDFDEEDEDSTIVTTAAIGRKIPRVIPVTERRRSKSLEDVEDDINRDEILKVSESFNEKRADSKREEVDSAFNELMEITSVPELPDVHNTLKCEQNFHNIKTIKFPDKNETVESPKSPPKSTKLEKKDTCEVATKLTNPKKRFVKSFEDFELMQNEIRRREELSGQAKHDEYVDGSLDRSDSEVIIEEVKPAGASSSMTFSLSNKYDDDDVIEVSKLKSKIMSKIIQEANINEQSKNKIMSKMQGESKTRLVRSNEDSNSIDTKNVTVESKNSNIRDSAKEEIQSTEQILPNIKEYKFRRSHRTPRSKILESYMNDTNRNKSEEKIELQQSEEINKNSSVKEFEVASKIEEITEERLQTSSTQEHIANEPIVPPKKNKWSRRGSHPKKDRNLFIVDKIQAEDKSAFHTEDSSENTKEELKDLLKSDDKLVTSVEGSMDIDKPLTNDLEKEVEEEAEVAIEINKSCSILPEKEIIDGEVDSKVCKSPLNNIEQEIDEVSKSVCNDAEKNDANEAILPPPEDLKDNSSTEVLVKTDLLSIIPLPEENYEHGDVKDNETVEIMNTNIPEGSGEMEEVGLEISTIDQPSDITFSSNVDEDVNKSDSFVSTEETITEEATDNLKVDGTVNEIVSHQVLVAEEMKEVVAEETCSINALMSPGRDEFSSIGNASLSLPEDAICTPPKKSKKCKLSEDNNLEISHSITEVEPTLDKFFSGERENKEPETVVEQLVLTDEIIKSDSSDIQNEIIPMCLETEVKEPQNMDVDNTKVEVPHNFEAEVTECEKQTVTNSEANEVSDIDKKENENAESIVEPLKTIEHNNEVEIQCAASSADCFKFSIQTNLSNLSSSEEISAIALATLSEIKTDLEKSENNVFEDTCVISDLPKPVLPEKMPVPTGSELVPIEGNLTVVTETDLADGQVEITSDQVICPKKPVTLSNFSMDFSDSTSDSNSTNDTFSDASKNTDFDSKGTEFSSKAITKEIKTKLDNKKENTYERLELLDILEGNSDSERKAKEYVHPKKSIMEDICDFEEHIPSQIVCAKKLNQEKLDQYHNDEEKGVVTETTTTSKLLERLTDHKSKDSGTKVNSNVTERNVKNLLKGSGTLSTPARKTKYIVKSKSPSASKPIILSEQIIKPAGADSSKSTSKIKRTLNDIEDVEAFVIHKDPKKIMAEEDVLVKSKTKTSSKSPGKAKILQQTIITPAGEIIQPTVNTAQVDDNIFDINSMPIVLSDEILTPESIENIPIVIENESTIGNSITQEKVLMTTAGKKINHGRIISKIITTSTSVPTSHFSNKNVAAMRQSKAPRILQNVGTKIVKHNSPLLPNTAKPGKYIIVPQSAGVSTSKYVTKKAPIIKRSPSLSPGIISKVPSIAPEPSGNKIMIVTNQQGQQQRLLLTPAQQKMLGYQAQGAKIKTVVKGNVLQKSVLAGKTTTEAGTSGVTPKLPNLVGQKIVVGTNSNTNIMATSVTNISQAKSGKISNKRPQAINQKIFSSGTNKTQKTILIKNQHGQTVKKIQGTDDELLDKQVAEQLEAIKASSGMKFSCQSKQADILNYKSVAKTRRSYSKKIDSKFKVGPPPLTGIQPISKTENVTVTQSTLTIPKKTDISQQPSDTKSTTTVATDDSKTQPDRPLNQLVIQDAVGNQTTITEGQILALPSETVDGQPQSYMLVTLDESGNLTPLNSEALMSLDPNLGLGGDLSNMVLQIDQSALTSSSAEQIPLVQPATVKTSEIGEPSRVESVKMIESSAVVPVPQSAVTTEIAETVIDQKVEIPITEAPVDIQSIVPSTNGDPGQQLIVTGDPIATQKFLESLTEGTTDLANILANADGNSILIQADGQQILINTNSDNQMLLSVNSDSINVSESTEGDGNPIFANQPNKNQDILAAALADTDVFQQEQHGTQSKITSQLSPNNTLYPINVGNVLETSLTLSSPIMTPLEVPSTNNKKIPDDEADILTQVPKNVDLPITITDPNISQTVANQQVASLIASELQTNLELALPISETTISAVSTEMNSPSYVYSLPTLDDSVDITQKPFNSSMPLLNEDVEESPQETINSEIEVAASETPKDEVDMSSEDLMQNASVETEICKKSQNDINSDAFLEEEEGRFTLGGEMCSSLSEPPPEMFDLPEVNSSYIEKHNANIPSSLQSTPDPSDSVSKDEDTTDLSTQAESSSEGSCEIPVQPQIITKSLDLSHDLDSLKRSLDESDDSESKKCKFD